ncbi:MAG: pyridoxal phosphate-dependent aminotransferase [Desulfobulbaceae bacterium]|nr:pyridoxal phosphate-dependent aminotransferase [Desulfobulbaceae bacterium]
MTSNNKQQIPGFREVPKTGVIYVMTEAMKHGYTGSDPAWSNLGQGSPETGPIPGAPPRIESISLSPGDHNYADIEGQMQLRRKVADFYNKVYRKGKASQYTYENVSISGGGRSALTRVATALGNINVGHFLPDYTAYEELLSVFRAFIPIPILLNRDAGYKISVEDLRKEILGRGLQAVLLSNPCNPTGQVIRGDYLKDWVRLARETASTLILDEFYSHFVYDKESGKDCQMLSGAEFVEDVNSDPLVILNGLTKNWRYPGWRISWTLAPKTVIDVIASAGSFLDGGANNPIQRHTIPLLEPEYVYQEAKAIQEHFGKKKKYMAERLAAMNIEIEPELGGTFYFWANLAKLPEPLRDGQRLFLEGLKEKVITVPGVFFDVNPDRRRSLRRYETYSRISFGAEMEKLETGLDSLERVIGKFS